MTRSYLVISCLVIWAFLATGTLPSNADSACCARTYRCNLRSDCRCRMREIWCRDPTEGILTSGKRSAPTDRQLNAAAASAVLESSGGYQGKPIMRTSSLLRAAHRLSDIEDNHL